MPADARFDMSAWGEMAKAKGSKKGKAAKEKQAQAPKQDKGKRRQEDDAEVASDSGSEDAQDEELGSDDGSMTGDDDEDLEMDAETSDLEGNESGEDGAGEGSVASGSGSGSGTLADDGEHSENAEASSSKVLKPLSKAELERFNRKQKKKGVIYISSIPHGMTVPKVKHLLESFGEVERIYLNDGSKPGEKRKRTTAHFTEGWVEFSRKRVAKTVAEVLNAQPIGAAAVTRSSMRAKGGPGGAHKSKNTRRYKDEVWTMKYLPGFKWHMLTEQLANERASRTARLRTELSQSAFEQKDYLRKVERARIMQDKAERRKNREAGGGGDAAAGAAAGAAGASGSGGAGAGDADAQQPQRDGKRVRTFKQRAPVLKDVRDLAQQKRGSGGPDGAAARPTKQRKIRSGEAGKASMEDALRNLL